LIYLVIMFAVGAVGIGSLFVQQRRERAHMGSVEGFSNALSKIAPSSYPGAFRKARPQRRPGPHRVPGRPVPMTEAQRVAARRRVEARRRARTEGRHRARSAAARRVS
jgi:hypothetical protein